MRCVRGLAWGECRTSDPAEADTHALRCSLHPFYSRFQCRACVRVAGPGGCPLLVTMVAKRRMQAITPSKASPRNARATAASPIVKGAEGLSPFAKKLPRLARNGKDDFDDMLPTYEATIKQIITTLQADPRLSLVVGAQLSNGGTQRATDNKTDALKWDDSYTKLWRLPKYFFVAVMIKTSDLTREDLDRIDGKDSGAIRLMADMILQMKQQDPLPAQLLDKDLCFSVFCERVRQIGERAKDWKLEAVRSDGTIDWMAGGAYRLIWDTDDTKVMQIEHRGSKLRVDVAAENITREWTLSDPCHEMLTEFKFKAKRIQVHQLFDDGLGPHQWHIDDAAPPSKRKNSFADLASLRAGQPSALFFEEESCQLTVAKSARAEKMKALAQAGGTSKRLKALDLRK